MKQTKKGIVEKAAVSSQWNSLCKRLDHALQLGFSPSDAKQKKWHSNDVEVQRMALRSISAFLNGVSVETLRHPLIKDYISDIIRAMEGILLLKNEAVCSSASGVVENLVCVLPNSMIQPHVLHLIHPLVSLLSCHQSQVAIASARILKLIISNLSVKNEKEGWELLRGTGGVAQMIRILWNFLDEVKSNEYGVEMASLLSTIAWRWPSSRYSIWSNDELLKFLWALCLKSETTVTVVVFQLFSALALCDYGAQKLLSDGDALIEMVAKCMSISYPHSVRIESFKLAQTLMVNEQRFSKIMKSHCENIAASVVSGMTGWKVDSGKVSGDEMSLLVASCRLALNMLHWPGKHHKSFWKLGIHKILYDLAIYIPSSCMPRQLLSTEEMIKVLQESADANFLLCLRPYVCEILGWVAAHCEGSAPDQHENMMYLSLLISSTCMAFVDSIDRKHQHHLADPSTECRSMAAAKATLMMMYSPSKFIAFQARSLLSELLKHDGRERLHSILCSLNLSLSRNFTLVPNRLQIVIYMIALACYSGLPEFYQAFVQGGGVKTLMAFASWWLNNGSQLDGISLGHHLQGNGVDGRSCCGDTIVGWEGKEAVLLLALWCLSELVNLCHSRSVQLDVFAGQPVNSKEKLIEIVQSILTRATSSGVRWYASYLMSFFGVFGFIHEQGRRIEAAVCDKELADIQLLLRSGECLNVHGVILLVRCPSMLPPQERTIRENLCDQNFTEQVADRCSRVKKEVYLSAHVEHEVLVKVLEFIYTGYLQAGEDLVRKLKVFARYCNLQPLLRLLNRKRPKWGDPTLDFDFSQALGPYGLGFSDIILQAMSSTKEEWTCSWCPSPVQHVHAHRIILWSSCKYLQALLCSGMRESQSQTLLVPISLTALQKLTIWFYSSELPKPAAGCLWDHMDVEAKLLELQPYVELCWLGEFWLMNEVQEECFRIITSSLDSEADLSVKILQVAFDFFQWKLVQVAVDCAAPFYHQLRESRALDVLNEELIELIRVASVHLSQERH